MKIPTDDTIVYDRPLATVWFDKDGILNSVSKNVPRFLGNSIEHIQFIKSLTKDKPVCFITDMSKGNIIDKEVSNDIKKEFQNVCKALAIVATSPLGKMTSSFISVLAPSSVPTKIFTDEQEAKQWLQQYLPNKQLQMEIPKNTEVIELHTSTNWFNEEGMFCSVAKNSEPRSLEEAKKTMEDFLSIIGNKKVCMLLDITHFKAPKREVRLYVAEQLPKFIKANAIISKSPLSRMVANMIFYHYKPTNLLVS